MDQVIDNIQVKLVEYAKLVVPFTKSIVVATKLFQPI
jgi:hypothetical protein